MRVTERLYLIVRIAGQTAAIAASDVSSVVEVDAITPVPCVPAHVAGLFALRSRVLTVIDAQAALGYAPMATDGPLTGVIITADGHGYALLVDDVADVIGAGTPEPCNALLGHGWSAVAEGQITVPNGDILVIDPMRLIATPIANAA
jgi:purine-binding chemotaxis protein CheW